MSTPKDGATFWAPTATYLTVISFEYKKTQYPDEVGGKAEYTYLFSVYGVLLGNQFASSCFLTNKKPLQRTCNIKRFIVNFSASSRIPNKFTVQHFSLNEQVLKLKMRAVRNVLKCSQAACYYL